MEKIWNKKDKRHSNKPRMLEEQWTSWVADLASFQGPESSRAPPKVVKASCMHMIEATF